MLKSIFFIISLISFSNLFGQKAFILNNYSTTDSVTNIISQIDYNSGDILNKITYTFKRQEFKNQTIKGDNIFFDIAVNSNDDLFFVTDAGIIYKGNYSDSNKIEYLGSFNTLINALVVDSSGILYGVGNDSLFQYKNSIITFLGVLPKCYQSEGDLFFYKKNLYLSAYVDKFPYHVILEININNPELSIPYLNLDLNYNYSVFGTISVQKDTVSKVYLMNVLYDSLNFNTEYVELDMEKKLIKNRITTFPFSVYGAATYYNLTSDVSNFTEDTINIISNNGFILCDNKEMILSATKGTNFKWSTGDTTRSIKITEPGIYSLEASFGTFFCSTLTSKIEIKKSIKPIISTQDSLLVCKGEKVVLSTVLIDNFKWNTGDTTSQIEVSNPDSYYLFRIDSNECLIKSNILELKNFLSPEIIVDNTNLCLNDSKKISSQDAINYLWNTGDTTQSIIINSPGKYYVKILNSNNCYLISDTINIKSIKSQDSLHILKVNGNLFSPYFNENKWFFNENQLINDTNIFVNCNLAGNYFVVGKDTNGCLSKSKNEFFECSLNDDFSLSIYPNPTFNILFIEGKNIDFNNCQIYLEDLNGKIIISDNILVNNSLIKKELNLSKLADGFYFLKIKSINKLFIYKIELIK